MERRTLAGLAFGVAGVAALARFLANVALTPVALVNAATAVGLLALAGLLVAGSRRGDAPARQRGVVYAVAVLLFAAGVGTYLVT